jgi:hypothetical protein
VEQGQHFGDDKGTNGVGGERAAWGEFFPTGKFKVQAVHAGGDDAQITLTAFLGEGAQLKQTVLTPIDPQPPLVLKSGETYTATYKPSASTTKSQGAAAQKPARSPKPGGKR